MQKEKRKHDLVMAQEGIRRCATPMKLLEILKNRYVDQHRQAENLESKIKLKQDELADLRLKQVQLEGTMKETKSEIDDLEVKVAEAKVTTDPYEVTEAQSQLQQQNEDLQSQIQMQAGQMRQQQAMFAQMQQQMLQMQQMMQTNGQASPDGQPNSTTPVMPQNGLPSPVTPVAPATFIADSDEELMDEKEGAEEEEDKRMRRKNKRRWRSFNPFAPRPRLVAQLLSMSPGSPLNCGDRDKTSALPRSCIPWRCSL